jgi:hypothetical protein
MAKRSRYADVKTFEPDALGNTPFRGLLPRSIARASGAVEHTIVAGERLDRLALSFFNDDRYWWRIVDANVGFLCGTDVVLELSEAAQPDDPLGRVNTVGSTLVVPPKEG